MTVSNALLQHVGRAKYSILPVSNADDSGIVADHTYSIADADQVRQAIGWEYGTDHWAFNADGTAKVLSGETIIVNSGQRVSVGQKPFDSTLPALTLSPDCPGKLKQVQEWRKVASAREIGKL